MPYRYREPQWTDWEKVEAINLGEKKLGRSLAAAFEQRARRFPVPECDGASWAWKWLPATDRGSSERLTFQLTARE